MIFSVLAFTALVISVCIKERKKSLFVQSLDCIFEALYNFYIYAYTGAILSLVNFIRSFLFINKDDFSKKFYLGLLILFESVILINCIMTWDGVVSLLPTIGSLIRTYCLWQTDMRFVRLSGITTGVFYGAYYLYYQSPLLVIGETTLIFAGMYAVWKHDVKDKFFQHKLQEQN